MSKLFISYRRKSWPFTHRLAGELHARLGAEIFVDFFGVDETDFEKSILRNLRESHVVLLIVTELTFTDRIHKDDDWVRREIREALTRNIPLVLVCVDGLLPPSGLPDDIKDVARMQGINFYPEYFTPAVEKLADFVTKISSTKLRTTSAPTPQPPTTVESSSPAEPPVKQKSISGRTTLSEALDLLEHGDHSKAIFLLESLRDSGYQSNAFNIHDLLRKAQTLHEAAERRRIAQINYDDIVELASRKITLDEAKTAFAQWSTDYADLLSELDIQNLRDRFAGMSPASPVLKPPLHEMGRGMGGGVASSAAISILDILPPPFEWVEIPPGKVTLEKGGYLKELTTFDVPAFAIAKYPITNAQYQVFVDAPDGYQDPQWWDYSNDAKAWRKDKSKPHDRAFPGDDHPRANVTRYESIAFCRWLNAHLSAQITLPTEQQWQRAAQAMPDGRDSAFNYPWGNDFDSNRCNTHESGVRQTTPVIQYPDGASPCGVMDMSGNVWEWCLTQYKTGKNDLNGTGVRLLRGGSWLNYLVVARAAYRYFFNPLLRDSFIGFRVVRPPSQ